MVACKLFYDNYLGLKILTHYKSVTDGEEIDETGYNPAKLAAFLYALITGMGAVVSNVYIRILYRKNRHQ